MRIYWRLETSGVMKGKRWEAKMINVEVSTRETITEIED